MNVQLAEPVLLTVLNKKQEPAAVNDQLAEPVSVTVLSKMHEPAVVNY